MALLTLFGILGLVIAVVGIYGLMAYVVCQRTHEIGIRMALGAPPSAILASVLGGALVQVVVGLALACWGMGPCGGHRRIPVRGQAARLRRLRRGRRCARTGRAHSRNCSRLLARRRPTRLISLRTE
jgi:hypothetical protein